MASMTDLHRAVQSTLASKRLGTPVFVRYLMQSRDKADAAVSRLAWLAGLVRNWVGQPVERIHAHGQSKNGYLGLTIEFRAGATAMIGWSSGAGSSTTADLMILGNHGALYFDEEEIGSHPVPVKPDAALLEVIERAIRAGRPEA